MDNKKPVAQVVGELAAWVRKNGDGPAGQTQLLRQLYDGLAQELLDSAPGVASITAPNLVVEVKDEATGRLYRRYLEVEYQESDNGICLSGEDMAGAPVQMVFLSNAALARMRELQGGGPNAPRCD